MRWQDAFKSNFMVEWMPESILSKDPQVSRPRVYIIDFESAVEFPEDCPPSERRCIGLPPGMCEKTYTRAMPPEMASGLPYDPFKLDVWQLGKSFSDFKVSHSATLINPGLTRKHMQTTIPSIDVVLGSMTDPDASSRPSASETLRRLSEAVSELPPRVLLIKPDCPDRAW